MGLIRDAATEAVRDLVRSTVLVGGLTALSGACAVAEGAVHAAGNIGHMVKEGKAKKEIKKAEKAAKIAEKENQKAVKAAKREEFINKVKNPTTLLSKYKHNMVALCSDKTDTRTYVFMTADNQIKYMTSGTLENGGIGLYNYDEEQIGSVVLEDAKESESGIRKISKVLSFRIGDSQIGTAEVTVMDTAKTIKLGSYFWNVWLKPGDFIAEGEDQFKMSPIVSISKKVYQVAYNDPGKEVILALTYIGLNEAKQLLKDNKL